MLKLQFVRNAASLHVTNSSFKIVIFHPNEILGISDHRSIRHYKIKHGVLQQNLGKYFRFESGDIHCDQFNKLVNTLKKEKEVTKDKFLWLDKDDKRRNISDKEILEKYMDLEKSCLSTSERKEIMEMCTSIKMHLV